MSAAQTPHLSLGPVMQPSSPALPVSLHSKHILGDEAYLVSNKPGLVSVEFVMESYRAESMYWTKPMDKETTRLMIRHSSVVGVYRRSQAADTAILETAEPNELEQLAMARFVTDHVTHAYLTDIYVSPDVRGKGLGRLLVERCNHFIERLPFLRKAILATSNPQRNAAFYQEQFGMSIPKQDPNKHLILMRKG